MTSRVRLLLIFPLLLALYEMAAYLSNDLYLPALSDIMQELQISPHLAQMTLAAWLLGSASLQLILGPVSDRFGRRPVLLVGGVVFITASLTCAMAQNITVLLVARFFQGATVCSVIVAGYASIHELLEQRKAIQVLAWMNGIIVLAPAFGPLLGGVILLFANWRWLFIILVIWGILVLLALARFMPESLPPEARKPIHLKKVFSIYWQIAKTRGFIVNTLVFCLLFAEMIAWIVIGPLLVVEDFKLNEVWFGIIQALVFGSYIIGTRVVKRVIETISISKLIAIGLSLTAIAATFLVLFSFAFPQDLQGFIASLMLKEFGAGLCIACLNRLAIESCADQPMGMRVALFSFSIGLSGAVASLLAIAVYNGTLHSLALLIAALIAAACLTYVFLGRPRSQVVSVSK